ncbi:hypothetical protein V2G26_021493 [Clonostachys chloroleuca]|uniref:Uncharacterized protein n=1 Tax=Clonostachys chloroleuca TaxID=1926264 RepID=A0AA35QF52_9HYPO|nr:unnamed protein product [Clonostachys chloroleuca]
MASSAQNIDPFSKHVRETTDKMVAEGHPERIVGDVHSLIRAVTKHFNLVPDSIVKSLPLYLHDIWYKCIQAGKNITAWSESQDVLVCHLVAVRNLGSPPPPAGSTKGNTLSDGRIFWSDLPLFAQDLVEEFTSRFYQKGSYNSEQYQNMGAFLGRLVSVGIYDGPALCTLSLFRETLEVPRSLNIDPESGEIPLDHLLFALSSLISHSGWSLPILASNHPSAPATDDSHPDLSGLGELAIKAGNIPSSGYSPQRWAFWMERLQELSQCGDGEVQSRAEDCRDSMEETQTMNRLL